MDSGVESSFALICSAFFKRIIKIKWLGNVYRVIFLVMEILSKVCSAGDQLPQGAFIVKDRSECRNGFCRWRCDEKVVSSDPYEYLP